MLIGDSPRAEVICVCVGFGERGCSPALDSRFCVARGATHALAPLLPNRGRRGRRTRGSSARWRAGHPSPATPAALLAQGRCQMPAAAQCSVTLLRSALDWGLGWVLGAWCLIANNGEWRDAAVVCGLWPQAPAGYYWFWALWPEATCRHCRCRRRRPLVVGRGTRSTCSLAIVHNTQHSVTPPWLRGPRPARWPLMWPKSAF